MILKRIKNILRYIHFVNTNIYIYIYIEMGLSETSLNTITKPFSFLSHCKVSCDSPCCVKMCGEDSHCIFNIDTHENAISDSDEGQIEKQYIHVLISFARWCWWWC